MQIALLLALAASGGSSASLLPMFQTNPDEEAADPEHAALGTFGIELENLSSTVRPGDDFFTFVNEGWLERSVIPPGYSRLGSFIELGLVAEAQVRIIIEEAAATEAPAGDARQQIGALYSAYLDTARIEELGLAPIRDELGELLALADHADVARWMGRRGTQSIVGLYISQDAGNPDRYLVHVAQSGLGLPDRDYYLREDEPFPAHRAAYRDYIEATFARAGIDDGAARADAIVALETKLATHHWTRIARRDREANYNLMTVAELRELAPGFPWSLLIEERGLTDVEELVVGTPTALRASAALFEEVPVSTWASWHAFHWIQHHADLLSAAYADASFELFGRLLNGVEEQRERVLRAVAHVNSSLGELVGAVYAERHFPPAHRAQMEQLVEYLRRAFAERIATLEWMDEETRAEAHAKLAAFRPKIGYPDRWRNYSELVIAADDLVGNAQRLSEWEWADSLARLSEPVREWEWGMTPQRVNAYYSSTRNEIVFPAAILQPPFFDPHADMAVNFGGIGGVIGHEMGHGFDDQGSRSDAHGVLRNWWTDAAREQFERRTSRLVSQYDSFEALPGMHVQGALALGENIGDLGGLAVAHRAYQLYLADQGAGEAPVLEGFSGDQRFFMAWAQVWRNLWTEEGLRAQLVRGPHSPPRYRVNGVVRNLEAWYEAFDVEPEAELYLPPAERVSIW